MVASFGSIIISLTCYWPQASAVITSIINIALSVPASIRSNSEFSISSEVGFTIYLSPTRPTRTPATAFDVGTSESALWKLLRIMVTHRVPMRIASCMYVLYFPIFYKISNSPFYLYLLPLFTRLYLILYFSKQKYRAWGVLLIF